MGIGRKLLNIGLMWASLLTVSAAYGSENHLEHGKQDSHNRGENSKENPNQTDENSNSPHKLLLVNPELQVLAEKGCKMEIYGPTIKEVKFESEGVIVISGPWSALVEGENGAIVLKSTEENNGPKKSNT
jgi:hypothetical protein